jgi:hypothetical protein
MSERYPGYDVLSKRQTLSWNEKTRQVIDQRLAVSRAPRFLVDWHWRTLVAICGRILPQPAGRAPVPLPALVDAKLSSDQRDGYRAAELPPLREAWTIGLAAIDTAALASHGRRFYELAPLEQDDLLRQTQEGALRGPAWHSMPSAAFFAHRVIPDITSSYYSHPIAWSEIGFGGPASPRGYVRMGFDQRDPWEAVEARCDDDVAARGANRRVG